MKISPGRKVSRAKSNANHASTDTEGTQGHFTLHADSEEQNVPRDDDEDESGGRKVKKKMRKSKSIRISVDDAEPPATRETKESVKRKRKKHRTTDLSKLKSSSIEPLNVESGQAQDDHSLSSLSARTQKKRSFRKSMQNSLSEHSKSSPYAATLKSKSKIES